MRAKHEFLKHTDMKCMQSCGAIEMDIKVGLENEICQSG